MACLRTEDPIRLRLLFLEISRLDLFGCQCAGGDERTRTADPLLAKQVLSQLSYIPARCDAQRSHNGNRIAVPPSARDHWTIAGGESDP